MLLFVIVVTKLTMRTFWSFQCENAFFPFACVASLPASSHSPTTGAFKPTHIELVFRCECECGCFFSFVSI